MIPDFASNGIAGWSFLRGWPLSSVVGLLSKRISSRLIKNANSAGDLRSTGITPLPRYYVPLRLPTKPTSGYLFPLAVCPHLAQVRTTWPGLSGSSIDLSAPAVLDHPGEPGRCL